MSRRDISYVEGHLFGAVNCLPQVISALIGDYLLNEKGAVPYVARFAIAPKWFESRVQQAYSILTDRKEDMESAIAIVNRLIRKTMLLAAV